MSDNPSRWWQRCVDRPLSGSYIDGQFQEGDGDEHGLVDPSTEESLWHYREAGPGLVSAAVMAAQHAQEHWAALPAAERGRRLWAVAVRIRQGAGPLAELEAVSAGKPIRDCRVEVQKVAEMFEYYAGWCDKLHGDVIPVPSSHLNYTRREPLGVVAQLTPWNAPLFTAGWQLAPALAAGNGVVLKPSEFTPLSSLVLAAWLEEAGLPRGLVNVVVGGALTGAALVDQPGVAKVVFVGSVATGRRISQAAAAQGTPTLLELGGKSANIVFADADIDRAVAGSQAAIFSAAGQSCVAGSRLLIQDSLYEAFVDRLAAATQKISIGLPLDDATHMGPLGNAQHYQRVQERIHTAKAEGARLVVGGERPSDRQQGYFLQPTLFTGVDNAMTLAQEEIFGPVLGVIPFADEAEAIAIANASRFGLAGAVWTSDVGRAHRVAAALQAGTVWINSYKTISVMSPFGGYRDSGYGRSSGLEALYEYTQTKSVWVETAPQPHQPFGYSGERS